MQKAFQSLHMIMWSLGHGNIHMPQLSSSWLSDSASSLHSVTDSFVMSLIVLDHRQHDISDDIIMASWEDKLKFHDIPDVTPNTLNKKHKESQCSKLGELALPKTSENWLGLVNSCINDTCQTQNNLPGTALLSGFQCFHGALKSSKQVCT